MSTNVQDLSTYTYKQHQKYIFFFQMLGTFLLTYAIGCSHDKIIGHQQNFVHCISLLLPLALAGEISGGYFNSSLTIAAYINKRHRILGKYMIAQFLGGLIGTIWCWALNQKVLIAYQRSDQYLQMPKFIINQLLGSFMFSVCVLTLTNKFTTHAYKSWQIYISIAASFYLVRKLTGDTTLNPNTSIFFQLASFIKHQNIDYLIDTWILIVPSTIGGILGGIFMHKIYEPLVLYMRFKNENLSKIKQQNSFTEPSN